MRALKTLKNLGLGLLLAGALIGCSKSSNPVNDDNGNGNNDAATKQQIVNLYYNWASFSQQHNYSMMMTLVIPGSNFARASAVLKSRWNEGYVDYYKFSSVEVEYIEGNSASVRGNWRLYQGKPGDISYIEDRFYSESLDMGNGWKLSGMNWGKPARQN